MIPEPEKRDSRRKIDWWQVNRMRWVWQQRIAILQFMLGFYVRRMVKLGCDTMPILQCRRKSDPPRVFPSRRRKPH